MPTVQRPPVAKFFNLKNVENELGIGGVARHICQPEPSYQVGLISASSAQKTSLSPEKLHQLRSFPRDEYMNQCIRESIVVPGVITQDYLHGNCNMEKFRPHVDNQRRCLRRVDNVQDIISSPYSTMEALLSRPRSPTKPAGKITQHLPDSARSDGADECTQQAFESRREKIEILNTLAAAGAHKRERQFGDPGRARRITQGVIPGESLSGRDMIVVPALPVPCNGMPVLPPVSTLPKSLCFEVEDKAEPTSTRTRPKTPAVGLGKVASPNAGNDKTSSAAATVATSQGFAQRVANLGTRLRQRSRRPRRLALKGS